MLHPAWLVCLIFVGVNELWHLPEWSHRAVIEIAKPSDAGEVDTAAVTRCESNEVVVATFEPTIVEYQSHRLRRMSVLTPSTATAYHPPSVSVVLGRSAPGR